MTGASVSFAGNLTDNPDCATPRAASPGPCSGWPSRGRREQSFFTVVVWGDQAEHAAQSLSKGSRVVVVANELGPSLRWATATTTRATRSQES